MTEVNEFQHPLVVPEVKQVFSEVAEQPLKKNDDGSKITAYWSKSGTYGNVVVRLDWELACGNEWIKRPGEDWNPLEDKVTMLMAEQVSADLSDLIVNGDTEDTSDYLLKMFDGEKKRGAELKSFDINSVTAYAAFHERKDSWEYTVYINASAGW